MDKFKKEQYIKQRYSDKSNTWSFQVNLSSDDLISRVFSVWKRIFKTALICEYVSTGQTLGIVVPTSKKPPKAKKEVIVSRETLDDVIRCINNKYSQNEAKCLTTALELMWYCGLRPFKDVEFIL